MTTFDIVIGVLSIILGCAAIGVAWKLYRMSEEGATRMRQSEEAIANHVRELDRIYGLLYSDTWSLVRDTYTTMQDRMWRNASGADSQLSELAVPKNDSTITPSSPLPPPAAPEQQGIEADAGDSDRLKDFLVDSYHRLSERGGRVRAQELISVAERLGYPFDDALNALHNVVFVEKRLYLASKRFSPKALVAGSAEEASRLQEQLADETIDDLARESSQA